MRDEGITAEMVISLNLMGILTSAPRKMRTKVILFDILCNSVIVIFSLLLIVFQLLLLFSYQP